jgi:hypothetical protein
MWFESFWTSNSALMESSMRAERDIRASRFVSGGEEASVLLLSASYAPLFCGNLTGRGRTRLPVIAHWATPHR